MFCFFYWISLNHEKRRKEMLRVSKDNATLAKRINELKSENSRTSWTQNPMQSENSPKYETNAHVSSKVRH